MNQTPQQARESDGKAGIEFQYTQPDAIQYGKGFCMPDNPKIKSPTQPDATATPRTDDGPSGNAPAVVAARRIACLASNGRGISVAEALAYIEAEFAPIERELTAAKAEIARYKDLAINGHLGSTVMAQVRAERAEAESAQLRAECRERTQWQCKCGGTDCAGQKENERLRAEVERLKKGLTTIRDSCENCTNGSDLRAEAALIIGKNEDKRPLVFHSEYYNCDRFSRIEKERDQLRARVAAMEQLLGEIAAVIRERTDGHTVVYSDRLRPLLLRIDAARAGKATHD